MGLSHEPVWRRHLLQHLVLQQESAQPSPIASAITEEDRRPHIGLPYMMPIQDPMKRAQHEEKEWGTPPD